MKKLIVIYVFFVSIITSFAQIQLKVPGVNWDELYNFDKYNVFKVQFFAKNNKLMRTMEYRTYYQTEGQNFVLKLVTNGKVSGMETIIDKKNEVAIQIFSSGRGAKPYYNTGGYKFPTEAELKKLELTPIDETKKILGFDCRKYTYVYKKIFGEVWITDMIPLSNDLGIFRAAKMASVHNTFSVGGFVMEMTTEDVKGGKTVMATVSLKNTEQYTVNLKGVKMNTAKNKINYFTF